MKSILFIFFIFLTTQTAQARRLYFLCSSQQKSFYVNETFENIIQKMTVNGLEFVINDDNINLTINEIDININKESSLYAEGYIDVFLKQLVKQATLLGKINTKKEQINLSLNLKHHLCIKNNLVNYCYFYITIRKHGHKTRFDLFLNTKVTANLTRICPRLVNRVAHKKLNQYGCVILSTIQQEIIKISRNKNLDIEIIDLMKLLEKISLKENLTIKLEFATLKDEEIIVLATKEQNGWIIISK